ncbi:hypothetical protein GF338_11885 [candidate division WOR-3 bacterium]|nr:hypothetical protein [candidate division WOR-3 bacterium]
MKKTLVLTAVVLIILGLSGMVCEKQEAEETREYTAADYHKVTISCDNGEITADAEAGEDIIVKFTKKGEDLSEIKITEDVDGVNLTITIDVPVTPLGYSCDVDLTLPEDIEVVLETLNGNVTVLGHQNSITLHSTSGNINATNISGEADLSSENGDINIEDHIGDIDAMTNNGSVDIMCRLQ